MDANKFQKCELGEQYLTYLLEYVNVLHSNNFPGFDRSKKFIHNDMILFILANRKHIEGEHWTILYRYICENVRSGRISQDMCDRIFPRIPRTDVFNFTSLKNIIDGTRFTVQNVSNAYQEWLTKINSYATILHENPSHASLFEGFVDYLLETRSWIGHDPLGSELRDKILTAGEEGYIPVIKCEKLFPTVRVGNPLPDLKNNIERELEKLNIESPQVSQDLCKAKTVEKADKKECPQQKYSVIVVSTYKSDLVNILKKEIANTPNLQNVQIFDGSSFESSNAKNIILGIYDFSPNPKENDTGMLPWAFARMASIIWPSVKVISYGTAFVGIKDTVFNISDVKARIRLECDSADFKKFKVDKPQNTKLENPIERAENDIGYIEKNMWIGVDRSEGLPSLMSRINNVVGDSTFKIGAFDRLRIWAKINFFITDLQCYHSDGQIIKRLLEVIPSIIDGGQILYLKEEDLVFSSSILDCLLKTHDIQLKRISTLDELSSILTDRYLK
jgi:hypothetical protein